MKKITYLLSIGLISLSAIHSFGEENTLPVFTGVMSNNQTQAIGSDYYGISDDDDGDFLLDNSPILVDEKMSASIDEAERLLPYAQMASGANVYKKDSAQVAGYKILGKQDLPVELQKFVKDEKSNLLEDFKNWSDTALRARVYQNEETGKVVLAFAGTELRPLMGSTRSDDWFRMAYNLGSSAYQALGWVPAIYEKASDWTEMLQEKFGKDNVEVTGTSMGGGLAQFSGLEKFVKVYAFNSVGLSSGVQDELEEQYGSDESLRVIADKLVTHVNVAGESLSDGYLLTYTVQKEQLGQVFYVPCYNEKLYGPQRHDISVVVKSLEAIIQK